MSEDKTQTHLSHPLSSQSPSPLFSSLPRSFSPPTPLSQVLSSSVHLSPNISPKLALSSLSSILPNTSLSFSQIPLDFSLSLFYLVFIFISSFFFSLSLSLSLLVPHPSPSFSVVGATGRVGSHKPIRAENVLMEIGPIVPRKWFCFAGFSPPL